MPCRDGGPDLATELRELQTKLDKVTRLLCAVLKFVEDETAYGLEIFALERNAVGKWWAQHKERDLAALRASGLAKLTESERIALGLKKA